MNKLRKIYFLITTLIIFSTASYSEIKDSIFATVGNKAITQSDIVNEIKTILILSNQAYSVDKRDQLQSVAVREAVKRNIKEVVYLIIILELLNKKIMICLYLKLENI